MALNARQIDYSSNRAYVLDGGFGSLVEQLGYNVEKHELWSGGAVIDDPQLVARAHQKFIDSGAEIIETNTYHCSIDKMMEVRKVSLAEAEDVIKTAVQCAHKGIAQSVAKNAVVVGSVGPYATYLRDGSEYTGAYVDKPNFSRQVIIDYYKLQCKPLIESDINCIVFETIPTYVEVECCLKVLDGLEESIKAWIVVSCEDGLRTRHGDLFADVVELATSHPKVVAVGINCTAPSDITSLLESAAGKNNGKPFVVYPNSGEIYNTETRKFEGDPRIDLIASSVPTWYALGARIFGGCCRVLPTHLEHIAVACRKINASLCKENTSSENGHLAVGEAIATRA